MTLPNFFIVGAAKSGTTTLHHCLGQHPDVFVPQMKEPHYFAGWDEFVKTPDEYEALFAAWSGQKAVGEASTGYLFDRDAPKRIKEAVPEARIIIILRQPADMAFALWRHMARIGKRGEELPFAEALEVEHVRMADTDFPRKKPGSWHGNFYYFNRALYYDQVRRYITRFGRDKVLVAVFEEFRHDPLTTCAEIFRFLGVDDKFIPKIERRNEGVAVWHRGLARLLDKQNVLPEGAKSALKRLNTKAPETMAEDTRRMLMERYMPDIKKLERLLGRDLSVWYGGR